MWEEQGHKPSRVCSLVMSCTSGLQWEDYKFEAPETHGEFKTSLSSISRLCLQEKYPSIELLSNFMVEKALNPMHNVCSIIPLWSVKWAYSDCVFIDEGLRYVENKAVGNNRVQSMNPIQIESSNLERLLWPTVLDTLCQLDTSESHLRGANLNWKKLLHKI